MVESHTTCETPLGQKSQLRDRKFIELRKRPVLAEISLYKIEV
jgi:hypothetical protein